MTLPLSRRHCNVDSQFTLAAAMRSVGGSVGRGVQHPSLPSKDERSECRCCVWYRLRLPPPGHDADGVQHRSGACAIIARKNGERLLQTHASKQWRGENVCTEDWLELGAVMGLPGEWAMI